MTEATPDDDAKLQELQAKAREVNLTMLVLKREKGQRTKYPIGPIAAQALLAEVTEHERMSGLSTIPVAAVERAGLDMEIWDRAVKSGVIKRSTLDGVPVFTLQKFDDVMGAGLIEHPFLDTLAHIAVQDPDKWQAGVKAKIAERRGEKGKA